MSQPAVDYNTEPPVSESSAYGDEGTTIFFWPILIFIIGTCLSTAYQIVIMQNQVHSMRQALVDQEPRVKQAQYEKDKLYHLASDVMQLAATDPLAQQIVVEHKIQRTAPENAPAATAPGAPTK